jgi:predicted RNA-binding protein with PUA domain
MFCDIDITPFGCSCLYKTHDVCYFCDDNRNYLFSALKMGIDDNFTTVRLNKTADEVRYILYTYLEVIKSQVVGEFIYYNDIRDIMDKYVLHIYSGLSN